MNHFEQNYEKNIRSLEKVNYLLVKKLLLIEENKNFDVIPITEKINNIYDIKTGQYLYKDPISYIKKALNYFSIKTEQPYFYIYGMGNGSIQKELLKKFDNYLTIIEPEIELLYIGLHCENFSEEISSKKITFLIQENVNFAYVTLFMNQDSRIYYARSFKIDILTPYYELKYSKNIMETNHIFLKVISYIATNAGNCIEDSLMGLEHHIYNLPYMIKGPQFKKFITQKNSDTVIMVSTGPSLKKQLAHLKKIQNYATIICADSALRILYNNDIVPDICVSLERVREVVDLLEDIPFDYKKQVIFFRASLQHKDIFKTILNCTDILVMRPHNYNTKFGLEPYGYICSATSVANMAHELCAAMKFTTCIIIGQDLAFGKKGVTHCKGHYAGDYDRADTSITKIELPAYGGKGIVDSHEIWGQFLNGLIQTIDATKDILKNINSTEGGVRIEGTEEIPFKKAIELFVNTEKNKSKIIPITTSKTEAKKYYKTASKNLTKILREGTKLEKILKTNFLKLAKISKKLENLTIEEQINILSKKEIINAMNVIDKTRNLFEENIYFKQFYWELMQSIVVNYEIELATIKTMPVNSHKDNQIKAIKWIFNHTHYFYTIAGAIQNTIFWIKKGRKNSLKELPENLKFLVE